MAFADIERLFHSDDISEILEIWKKYAFLKFDSKLDKMVLGGSPFVMEFIKYVKRKSNIDYIYPRVLSLHHPKFYSPEDGSSKTHDLVSEVRHLYRSGEFPFSFYFYLQILIVCFLDKNISVKDCRFNPFQVITVSQKILDWTARIYSTYPLKPDSLLIDGFNPIFITPNGFGFVKGKSSCLLPFSRSSPSHAIFNELDLLKKTIALIDLGIAVVEKNQLKMTPKNTAIFEEAEQYPDDEKNEWWVKWHVRLQHVGVGRKETALIPVKGHFRHRAA